MKWFSSFSSYSNSTFIAHKREFHYRKMYAMNIYCFTFSGQLSLEISILSYRYLYFGIEWNKAHNYHWSSQLLVRKIWTKDGILMNRKFHVKIFNMLSWWMWFNLIDMLWWIQNGIALCWMFCIYWIFIAKLFCRNTAEFFICGYVKRDIL